MPVLAVDRLNVKLYCVQRDIQPERNALVRKPLSHGCKDIEFTRREEFLKTETLEQATL
jgi:hypothetical protein